MKKNKVVAFGLRYVLLMSLSVLFLNCAQSGPENDPAQPPQAVNKDEESTFSSDQCDSFANNEEEFNLGGNSKLIYSDNNLTNKVIKKDLLYQAPQSWSEELSKLDVYYTSDYKSPNYKAKPVIVFIHGGGTEGTDKSEIEKYPIFIDYFLKKGFLFVSLNYRLFQSTKSPGTTYKEQVTDVARAIKWIHTNIGNYGGKADDLVLLGFSTAAHFVSLLNTDFTYLNKEGLPLDIIKGVISFDVPHYNIPLALKIEEGTIYESLEEKLKILYGSTEELQKLASPVTYIKDNKHVKPILLISAGIKDGKPQEISYLSSLAFKNELLLNNHSVRHYHFAKKDHTGLIKDFLVNDDEVAVVVDGFLNRLYQVYPQTNKASYELKKATFDKINDKLGRLVSSKDLNEYVPGAVVGFISADQSMMVSCGSKSMEEKQRPDTKTFFSIGSVSKIMTSLILAQLVVEGKMKLEDPLVNYLSDVQLKEKMDKKITLKQLVTHTSGLMQMPSNMLGCRISHPV